MTCKLSLVTFIGSWKRPNQTKWKWTKIFTRHGTELIETVIFSIISFIYKSSNFNQPQFQSVQDGGQIGYVSYWNSASKVSFEKLSIFFWFVTFILLKNKAALQKIRVQLRSRLKYLCINDLMEHEKPEAVQAKLVLDSFYKELYPKKSSFEL